MLGTRTRLSFVGRDKVEQAAPPLGSVMKIAELRAVAPSGGKRHAELSLCRVHVCAAAKVLEGMQVLGDERQCHVALDLALIKLAQ